MKSKFNTIRQIIADSKVKDFTPLYRALYDEVDENHTVAIPEDLLEELEWKEGDILEWEYHDYNGLPGLRLHKVGDD